VLSKLKVTTTEILGPLILVLVSIWVFGWIEEKLFGHTTGVGIFVGWIVGLMIAYGVHHFRKTQLEATEGKRREAGEE
jgi:hypothetical protein